PIRRPLANLAGRPRLSVWRAFYFTIRKDRLARNTAYRSRTPRQFPSEQTPHRSGLHPHQLRVINDKRCRPILGHRPKQLGRARIEDVKRMLTNE
ncbi:MAG TPA: hypothetical protein VIS06_21495, partial [Mycobacteriales bacterium]